MTSVSVSPRPEFSQWLSVVNDASRRLSPRHSQRRKTSLVYTSSSSLTSVRVLPGNVPAQNRGSHLRTQIGVGRIEEEKPHRPGSGIRGAECGRGACREDPDPKNTLGEAGRGPLPAAARPGPDLGAGRKLQSEHHSERCRGEKVWGVREEGPAGTNLVTWASLTPPPKGQKEPVKGAGEIARR